MKKINLRNDPMIRIVTMEMTEIEKELVIAKFFKGAYVSSYSEKCKITLYKSKSIKTLTCDSMEISKVEITHVINNCGLEKAFILW